MPDTFKRIYQIFILDRNDYFGKSIFYYDAGFKFLDKYWLALSFKGAEGIIKCQKSLSHFT